MNKNLTTSKKNTTHAILIQEKSTVNAYGVHTSGNSKTVYCITNGDIIVSLSDTAEKYNLSKSALSRAISLKKPMRNGLRFCYAKDMPEYIEEISQNMRQKTKVYDEVTAWSKANEELEIHKARRDRLYAQYEAENQLVAKAEAKVNDLRTSHNIWRN